MSPLLLQDSNSVCFPTLIWHISFSRKETSDREAPGKAWHCQVCPTSVLHHLLQSPWFLATFGFSFCLLEGLFAQQHLQKGCLSPASGRWAWCWERLPRFSCSVLTQSSCWSKCEVPNEVIRIMRQRCEPQCCPSWDSDQGDHTGDWRLQQGRKEEGGSEEREQQLWCSSGLWC